MDQATPTCALSSGTAALHLALILAGVGPGDLVPISSFTFAATAFAVKYLNANPVLIDSERNSWNISPDLLKVELKQNSGRIKAVVAVDIFGQCADYDHIRSLCDQHDAILIEDAAEAFGSEYHGRRAGCFGDTGVFSFHGSKTLTTGEGGMFVTDREDLYRRVLVLRDHGRAPGDTNFFNHEIAFKYRMSSLQAAFGLAQLERADELIARKRELFAWYQEDLADCPHLTLNAEPAGTKNSYWMITAILDPARGIDQIELRKRLSDAAIDSRPFFHPLRAGNYSMLIACAVIRQ